MNSPIKQQITLTDAYKACLEAIVYVCFASSGNEEVIYNPKTTNDGILQMLYPIILCTTIKFIIYNRIPKYLLHTRVTDNQKDLFASTYYEFFGVGNLTLPHSRKQ